MNKNGATYRCDALFCGAAGKIDDPAVYRGVRFLLDRQRNDGTWFEPEFTGTGFPLVFYLKYHYYSVYFPLMALSLYAAKTNVANVEVCENETILRMQKMRIFSPETAYYNNARPNDPPIETPMFAEAKTEEPNRKPLAMPTLRVFFG